MTRHILHLAMPTLREPIEEPRLRRGKVRIGEAHRLEAELGAPATNLLGEYCVVHDFRS